MTVAFRCIAQIQEDKTFLDLIYLWSKPWLCSAGRSTYQCRGRHREEANLCKVHGVRTGWIQSVSSLKRLELTPQISLKPLSIKCRLRLGNATLSLDDDKANFQTSRRPYQDRADSVKSPNFLVSKNNPCPPQNSKSLQKKIVVIKHPLITFF